MSDPILLHHLLDDAAGRFPDRTAVSYRDAALSYRDLAESSRRIAGWLVRRGVVRGDRIVVLASTGVHTSALLYAASRIGAAVSIIHEQVVGRPLEHVLDDCRPVLLVTTELAEVGPTAARRRVAAVALDEVLAASEAEPPWSAAGGTVPAGPIAVDPVCLIYTSGSTAMPKAVVCAHQQMLFAARAIQAELGYRADDRVYCPVPLSFDYGLYQLFLGALSGAEVCLGAPSDAGVSLLTNLNRTRATVLAAVPSVAESLIRLCRRGGRSAPALRLVTNTGAALTEATVAELRAVLPGARVRLMFGLTECKRVAIMPPDGDLLRPGSCGRPLPGTEVLVVGETGERLGPGEVGEFVVRGPHVMAGYWRRPELTAQRFRARDGLFPELHTGDYGWLDEDGYLYFVGRRDDLYKAHGFRVSCTEVEAAVRRVPGVRDAVVLPPAGGRRHAVAVVVGELTGAQVLGAMRGELEEFKIPERCLVVDALPLTANGKVHRGALGALVDAPVSGRTDAS